jgi:hypothetical protein
MSSIGLSIPRKIQFKAVLSNASDGPPIENYVLHANQTEFNEFFDGRLPAAQIDSGEGFAFAVGLGRRPTGGYAINVRPITRSARCVAVSAITINYEELVPSQPLTKIPKQ